MIRLPKAHWPWILVFSLSTALSGWAETTIENYGSFASSETPWIINVSQSGITFSHGNNQGVSMAVSPKWEAHPGWFVFVENPRYTWAYDGANEMLLDEFTPTLTSVFSLEHLPVMPPKEVFNRLPPKVQQILQKKFPADH